jgi:hypothetical protein
MNAGVEGSVLSCSYGRETVGKMQPGWKCKVLRLFSPCHYRAIFESYRQLKSYCGILQFVRIRENGIGIGREG